MTERVCRYDRVRPLTVRMTIAAALASSPAYTQVRIKAWKSVKRHLNKSMNWAPKRHQSTQQVLAAGAKQEPGSSMSPVVGSSMNTMAASKRSMSASKDIMRCTKERAMLCPDAFHGNALQAHSSRLHFSKCMAEWDTQKGAQTLAICKLNRPLEILQLTLWPK